jgi:hypothetical protein
MENKIFFLGGSRDDAVGYQSLQVCLILITLEASNFSGRHLSHLPDLVDTVALVESGCNGEYALVRMVDQLLVNILHNCKVILMKLVVQLY